MIKGDKLDRLKKYVNKLYYTKILFIINNYTCKIIFQLVLFLIKNDYIIYKKVIKL